MAADKIHMAMDLKEATSLKDPFSTHVIAPDTEAVVELDKEVLSVFESDRPNHDKIEKLLTMQSSLGQHAHVKCTPEDEMWRDQMNDAVRQMDQTA
jgi:hypothetical protein